ncbi:hypothetical protein C2869_12175 [Saccharobesus litoralis]|uniref:OmpA-like domain-containing protein n=1 Tax=Saccharobesus litoralis TaxID=2172099 RepID=A0A2S0VSF6_9ALTE|nr:sortase-associated OmpA-like protein PdsO [Saccharobesus litoralis]AWB67144.1 hypothetical protein C2869_12175 [Saccharobesus litoralis]
MKKALMTSSLILALSTAPVFTASANENQSNQQIMEKNQLIGFGGGATVGAIVGGPLGGILGGVFGTLIGTLESNAIEKQGLEQNLSDSKLALSSSHAKNQQLHRNVQSLNNQNQDLHHQLRQVSQTLAAAEVIEDLKLDLQFTSGSNDVQAIYAKPIGQIASLVKQNPDLQVKLSGYADRTGDAAVNLDLSKKRVAAVKQLLVELGVNQANISTQAYGESSPLFEKQTYQNDFFDRRVEIKLQPKSLVTAAND